MAEKGRVIKRGADLHLYDTVTGKRLTYNSVRQMIVAGIALHFVDERSGHDITQAFLTALIVEKERSLRSRNSGVLFA